MSALSCIKDQYILLNSNRVDTSAISLPENNANYGDKGSSLHITDEQHKILVYSSAQPLTKTGLNNATYMEKRLDHFAWSTPCGREVNYYKLVTSRLQFCLKLRL